LVVLFTLKNFCLKGVGSGFLSIVTESFDFVFLTSNNCQWNTHPDICLQMAEIAISWFFPAIQRARNGYTCR